MPKRSTSPSSNVVTVVAPEAAPPQHPPLDEELSPHIKTTLYFTFAFCVAWSWDLVVYGASHVLNGMSPLKDQLSFGDSPGPKSVVVLVMQYLGVCGGAAIVSDQLNRNGRKWTKGANTAVQFFPSAVFGGKLLGYLGQFMSMGAIERAVINLGATLFAAFLANMMPNRMSRPFTDFGTIVRETLGFGLGIAWNIFLGSLFGPTEQNAAHLVGLVGYLALITLIAFRVAAEAAYVDTVVEPNTIDRMWGLLSFAMNVACAFTLVALVNALLPEGWVGDIQSFFVLLIFSAIMSVLVGRVDLSRAREEASGELQNNWSADHLPCILRMLIFLPCVWCCCPWLPVLFILSGTSTIGVKEKWFQLVAMISGLSASIEASGMLTKVTGLIAGALGICDEKHCHSPWMFVLVQVGIAVVTTIILIPVLVLVVPPFLWSPEDEAQYITVHSIEYVPEDSISLLTPIPPPSSSRRSKYESV